jgi:L-fuculose-phosphate aldolase
MNDESFDQISKNLCDAIGMLEHSGLIDYNGHVSCRMADGSIAINSGASNRAALGQSDITVVNAAGQTRAGRSAAPRERFLHTQLYAARSDVHAIVHAHSIWSTTLSTSGIEYAPVFAQGALVGEVPLFPDVASIGTIELGRAVASCLGNKRALILQSHGIVVCGSTVQEAVVLSYYLEENARRQVLALGAGRCRPMTEAERAAAAQSLWSADLFDKAWCYYHAKWARVRVDRS